ncbi:MAG: hypothetical protein ACPK85_16480 [Methanosarcina sp.]
MTHTHTISFLKICTVTFHRDVFHARASANAAIHRIKNYFSKASNSPNPGTYLASNGYYPACQN